MGLVVWQSAFLLAELLVRSPPFGAWGDVRVVDLGTGTGENINFLLIASSSLLVIALWLSC